MPFKTNFSEKDFEKEIQRLYFEIIDESLKLWVYDKQEFDTISESNNRVVSTIVNLHGLYHNLDDFDDEGTTTILSKIVVEEDTSEFIFILCPPKQKFETLTDQSVSIYTDNGKSSSYQIMSRDSPQNSSWIVDKLEVVSFLKQNKRDRDDFRYFIENMIVSTDLQTFKNDDILEQCEKDLISQNQASKKYQKLHKINILPSNPSETNLNTHFKQISYQNKISTRKQAEQTHSKLYLRTCPPRYLSHTL